MRRFGRLVLRAVWMEVAGWRSLARFVLRRPRVPAGADAFPYDEPIRALLVVFVCVSAVEVVVVDLVVHRWDAVRIPLLAVGIWGVTFMLGLLVGHVTRPHAVGPDGMRIRYGGEVDLPVRWEQVYAVRHRKITYEKAKTFGVVDVDGAAALRIVVHDHTNLEITFEEPTALRIPTGWVTVSRLIFSADDPRAFMAAARSYLTEPAS